MIPTLTPTRSTIFNQGQRPIDDRTSLLMTGGARAPRPFGNLSTAAARPPTTPPPTQHRGWSTETTPSFCIETHHESRRTGVTPLRQDGRSCALQPTYSSRSTATWYDLTTTPHTEVWQGAQTPWRSHGSENYTPHFWTNWETAAPSPRMLSSSRIWRPETPTRSSSRLVSRR